MAEAVAPGVAVGPAVAVDGGEPVPEVPQAAAASAQTRAAAAVPRR